MTMKITSSTGPYMSQDLQKMGEPVQLWSHPKTGNDHWEDLHNDGKMKSSSDNEKGKIKTRWKHIVASNMHNIRLVDQ